MQYVEQRNAEPTGLRPTGRQGVSSRGRVNSKQCCYTEVAQARADSRTSFEQQKTTDKSKSTGKSSAEQQPESPSGRETREAVKIAEAQEPKQDQCWDSSGWW